MGQVFSRIALCDGQASLTCVTYMRHLHASRIKVALFFVQTTVFVYLFY